MAAPARHAKPDESCPCTCPRPVRPYESSTLPRSDKSLPVPSSRRLLFIVAALATLLAIPVSASAYAPGSSEFVECVLAGNRGVDCIGGFFDPGTEVQVVATAGDDVVFEGTFVADADGEVSFSFTVPDDVADGMIRVTLTGTLNGEPLTLTDDVAMVTDGEVLPVTGASSFGLLAMALAAVAVGGGILLVTRRRDTTRT